MVDLFLAHEQNRALTFLKLQVPGLVAHSWIVIDLLPTPSGYEIYSIDSNVPAETLRTQYVFGDTHLSFPYAPLRFVPHLDFQGDLRKMGAALTKTCGPSQPGNPNRI